MAEKWTLKDVQSLENEDVKTILNRYKKGYGEFTGEPLNHVDLQELITNSALQSLSMLHVPKFQEI